jgi:hypothetical protein
MGIEKSVSVDNADCVDSVREYLLRVMGVDGAAF